MSLAKLHVTKRSRKEWVCGKCRDKIPKGSGVIRFSVGYRGRPQERCMKPTCYPKPSERESSAVSSVYAAVEDAQDRVGGSNTDLTMELLEEIRDEVVSAVEEVADEYEQNEMFERNPDLQERADILRSAADELGTWFPENDEPTMEDWSETYEEAEDFDDAHAQWSVEAADEFNEMLDSLELP